MELRAWADRLLFGDRLEDKLCGCGSIHDSQPGSPIALPTAPSRPAGLGFDRKPPPLPGLHALDQATARGAVLHAFANHELLAIELMALALLRFPQAPAAFRRGLAGTIAQEQTHLRMYRERMRSCGVEFGEAPVSAFFWRAMSGVASPLEFVAHMGLTFEQANLDYCLQYAAAFRAVGDADTAEVLGVVLEDEVSHVKFGLRWFERWRDPGKELLVAHADALRGPMTLARAKGSVFDGEIRRRVGFEEPYIARLARFTASKGRPPVVHLFNPDCEREIATGGRSSPNRSARQASRDLEFLMAYLAAPDDVVLLECPPSGGFTECLHKAGFGIPQLIEIDRRRSQVDPGAIPHCQLGGLRPWGLSPASARFLRPLVSRLCRPPELWFDAVASGFSKATAAEALADLMDEDAPSWWSNPDTVGAVVSTVGAALDEIDRRTCLGYRIVVLKAPYGTAGRSMTRVVDGRLLPQARRWIEKTLTAQGAVVVEPWLDRVTDLSVRLVRRGQTVRVVDVARSIVDARGQYRGMVLGRLGAGASPSLARFLAGDGNPRRLQQTWSRVAATVERVLLPTNIEGPVGVDAFIHRSRRGALRLRPLVEINPRVTMGHIAARLGRRLESGATGVWLVVRREDCEKRGLDLAGYCEMARRRTPLEMVQRPGGPRIRAGVLATTDPALAGDFVTVLSVGASLAACRAALAPIEVCGIEFGTGRIGDGVNVREG